MVGWPVACVIALGCAPTIHRDKATPISTNDSYARHPSSPPTTVHPILPRYSSSGHPSNEFPLCSHRSLHRHFFSVGQSDFADNPKTRMIEIFDARSIVDRTSRASRSTGSCRGSTARRNGRRVVARVVAADLLRNRVPRHFSVSRFVEHDEGHPPRFRAIKPEIRARTPVELLFASNRERMSGS